MSADDEQAVELLTRVLGARPVNGGPAAPPDDKKADEARSCESFKDKNDDGHPVAFAVRHVDEVQRDRYQIQRASRRQPPPQPLLGPSHTSVLPAEAPAIRRAGLPDRLRFHDLRHSYATWLVSHGMGHEDVTTTLSIYTDVPDAYVERVEDVFEDPEETDEPRTFARRSSRSTSWPTSNG